MRIYKLSRREHEKAMKLFKCMSMSEEMNCFSLYSGTTWVDPATDNKRMIDAPKKKCPKTSYRGTRGKMDPLPIFFIYLLLETSGNSFNFISHPNVNVTVVKVH